MRNIDLVTQGLLKEEFLVADGYFFISGSLKN